jgi:hypothetical protein
MLFSPTNLPYWIFLGIGILLFLFVIVSSTGGEDVDIDSDVDFDVDTDLDTDIASDFSVGEFLGWAGIGKAPLILLLATDFSLWGVFGWMLNVWIRSSINLPSSVVSILVVLVSLTTSVLTGGLIAQPIGQIFAEFGEDASSNRLIGCTGVVTSRLIPIANQGRIGQVDVIDPSRNLLSINATVPEWATIIPKRGEKVLVIDRDMGTYLIVAKDSPDQELWLENSSKR